MNKNAPRKRINMIIYLFLIQKHKEEVPFKKKIKIKKTLKLKQEETQIKIVHNKRSKTLNKNHQILQNKIAMTRYKHDLINRFIKQYI